MKRIVIAFAVFLNCSLMMAQSELDVLKYIQTDLNGTARYMGMGGAFGALGGDASSIKDNPAGLGIYRKSELVATYDAMMQSTTSKWNSVSSVTEAPYKSAFSNFSFVVASPTWKSENGSSDGLLSSNWSFGYNRLKNFNRSLNIKSGSSNSSISKYISYFSDGLTAADLKYQSGYEPFDNKNVPWISVLAFEGKLMKNNSGTWNALLALNESVTPSYKLTESGHIDEYSLGWAGNFSNVFYLGTTLNLRKINYSATTNYAEKFGTVGSMSLNNALTTVGSGANLSIGTIIRPTDYLRFGLSLQTPTIYDLSDTYSPALVFDTDTFGISKPTSAATNDFQLQEPLKVNLSGALILGKKAIVSAEYEYKNYSGTRLMDVNGDVNVYSAENDAMATVMNNNGLLKVGAELKVTDNFSIRAGYANSKAASKSNAEKFMPLNTVRTDIEYFLHNNTNYFTTGFGYRESNWFVDVAFVNKVVDQSFYPYNSNKLEVAVQPASVITINNNVLVSLGFKF